MSAQAKVSAAASTRTRASSPSLVLQRKCVCGGTKGFADECEECRSRKLLGARLQTKLGVSQPGDQYEQEAEHVAEQVMRATDTLPLSASQDRQTSTVVQRRVSSPAAGLASPGGPGAPVNDAPLHVQEVLSSPGQPLDHESRAFFEPRFGHDFSRVRVHAGSAATQSARDLNAHAFTVGSDIVFGSGQYSPGSESGRQLIAHELVHTLQGVTNPRPGLAGATALRKPVPSAGPAAEPVAMEEEPAYRYQLGMMVTTEGTSHPSRINATNGPMGTREVDLSDRRLYEGDSFLLVLQDQQAKTQAAPVLTWSLPPELVRLEERDLRIHLRVVGGPATGAGQQPVEVELSTGDPGDIITIRLVIAETPSGLSGFGASRLVPGSNCAPGIATVIERAVGRAVDVAGGALAKLQGVRGDPSKESLLLDRFIPSRVSMPAPTPASDAIAVEKAIDVLTLARNNMLASDVSQFRCALQNDVFCTKEHPDAVAHVQKGAPRGATVELCYVWIAGDFKGSDIRSGIAVGVDESRAFALLHEFIHTAGPVAEGELFFGDSRQWRRLSTEGALGMADLFAVLAWELGK